MTEDACIEALRDAPDDAERWAVYADLLQGRGDVRGRLIALAQGKKARAERGRTLAERQLADAVASAQTSSAKVDRLATAHAATQQTLARRGEQLDAAKQRARELEQLNKPTSRAEAATRDQLESELREAKVQIGALKSDVKKLTTAANLNRKQSAASVAQAKAARGALDRQMRDGATRSAGEDIDLLHEHYAALLAAKDAEISALTTERDALRRIASPTARDVKPGGQYRACCPPRAASRARFAHSPPRSAPRAPRRRRHRGHLHRAHE